MAYRGHVIYDLLYESGEMFSMSEKFDTSEKLYHYTSFTYLGNMQEKYKVEEVRVAEVYIQGLDAEQTRIVTNNMEAQDTPMGDFGLFSEAK